MKNLLTAFLLMFSITCLENTALCQTYNPFYGEIVDQCSYDIVLNNLNIFESFGVKEHGTVAQNNTKNWIKQKYASYGYTDIVEDPFSYGGNSTANVIITKTGLVYPDKYLIVDAHYDTRNGPGTNDNGTGTILLMEIARLLADIDLEYSIKFIHFSGEEDGLIGSQHYVNNVVNPDDLDILLVFNIDQVGGINGASNTKIVCERDQSNPSSNNAASDEATDQLATCVSLYSDLTPEISFAYGSDYVPFENNGEVITGLYESNESPYSHTVNDNLSNMDVDYAFEVIKASVGASLHFAIAIDSSGIPMDTTSVDTMTIDSTLVGLFDNTFKENITIYPNPTQGNISVDLGSELEAVEIKLINVNGQTIKNSTYYNTRSFNLNIDESAGIYFLRIGSANKQATFKLIKENSR